MPQRQNSDATDSPIRIYTFDTPRIVRGDNIYHFKTRASLALCIYLAVERGRHQRDWISRFLWNETSADSARVLLRNALYTMKKTLGAGILETSRETISIRSDAHVRTDVDDLREAVSPDLRASGKSDGQNSSLRTEELIDLTHLFRKPFLEGFDLPSSGEYQSWAQGVRAETNQLFDEVFVEIVSRLKSEERITEAKRYGTQWISANRESERGYREVMKLHAESGEKADALSRFRELEAMLGRIYGTCPSPDTVALKDKIVRGDVSSGNNRSKPDVPHNLPGRVANLTGRLSEIRGIESILDASRMVTICGPGGSGKTTVAVEIGHRAAENRECCFVDLTAVENGNFVSAEVAFRLGLHLKHDRITPEHLSRIIKKDRLLLILDNCEHLITSSADVVERLITTCPNINILTTSREPLGLIGETIFRLPCLAYPNSLGDLPLSDIRDYEAVTLFLDRANRSSGFTLDKTNWEPVVDICRSVEGLPLALEIAGSLTGAMDVRDIAAFTEHESGNLPSQVHRGKPRHTSVNSAIEWSYELLSIAEKKLLAQLSVFRGGWTIDSARAVCDISDDVVPLLITLVRKSLVQLQDDGRYHMLEPIRQFADQKLHENRDSEVPVAEVQNPETIEANHLEWFMGFTRSTSCNLYTADQAAALEAIDIEYANITRAIEYARRFGRHDDILVFGYNLFWYWFVRGRAHDGISLLGAVAESCAAPENDSQARGLAATAYLCWWIDDSERGKVLVNRALEWADTHGDDETRAYAYLSAAQLHTQREFENAFDRATGYFRSSLKLYRKLEST